MTIAWIGWLATAIFAASYFVPKLSMLTKIQATAACLWIVYGMKIGAPPVIVANLIVAGAALFSSFRGRISTLNKEIVPEIHSQEKL